MLTIADAIDWANLHFGNMSRILELLQLVASLYDHSETGVVCSRAILQQVQQDRSEVNMLGLQMMLEYLETRGDIELGLALRQKGFPIQVVRITRQGYQRLRQAQLMQNDSWINPASIV